MSYDPRGPFRTIKSAMRAKNEGGDTILLTFEECDHTGSMNPLRRYVVGEQVRCCHCRGEGAIWLPSYATRSAA
jgi:hypothetical protein